MTKESLIDELQSDPTDVRGRFRELRDAVDNAQTQEDLTELYKRCTHMILMTHSSPVDAKQDRDLKRRRGIAEREFTRTVRQVNRRAKKVGLDAKYNENWEHLAANGYKTEEENLLEAQATTGIIKE